ncbi:MAG: methyltransferase domain-containing protein [Planctomycetes bacterium]|nr:methyltransferase domain-containing protein [Planctomycetota bacterium]
MSNDVEFHVRERYAKAAEATEAALCCPVTYDPRWLAVLPKEILERDYGCGDPSQHLRAGETVLDLGSGAGKIAYIASQVVGPKGRVIGVDMNDAMLALARKHRKTVGDAIGYQNVEFRKGRIQDLALDLELLEDHLARHPVRTSEELAALESWIAGQKRERPLVPTASVDVVVSNCVLNLVRADQKPELFREIRRVLKRGGRAVISDITSDEPIPAHLAADADLWSGCISGALREDEFLKAFEAAGFHGIRILARDATPWRVVEGIEFRSLTVEAFVGKDGPCLERKQAVVYMGPWKSVTDDDGHVLCRGERMAVCDKTFGIYTREPYASSILAIPPTEDIPLAQAKPFTCTGEPLRDPRDSKQRAQELPPKPSACSPGGKCC